MQIDSVVAVVIDSFQAACRGHELLELTWNRGTSAHLDSQEQQKQYAEIASKPGLVAAQKKDPKSESLPQPVI